jgi:hypothetical protein
MPRISTIEPENATLPVRLFWNNVRNKMKKAVGQAKILNPQKVTAHQPALLFSQGMMDYGQLKMRSVPSKYKLLASVKAASRIGCPF